MYPLDYNAYTTGLSSCRFQPNRHQGLTMAHAGPSEAAMQSQERYGHMQSNPDESSPSRYHSPAFVDDFTTTSVGLTNVVMRTTPSQSPAPSDDYSDTIYHKQAYVGGKQEYQPWAPVEWAPSGPPVPIGGEYGYMASAPRDYRTVASFIEGGGSSGQPMSYNPDAMPSGSHFQPPPMPQYSSRDSNPQPRHSTDDPPLAPLPQYSYPRSVDPRLSGLADMPRTSQRLAAETSMVSINSPSMISDGSRPPIRAPIAVPGSFPSYGYATRQSSRTEDPPVEDLAPKFRSTATAVQSSLSVTVFGVGVGNCGVAVRGERVSFDVTARTGSSELWQFQPERGPRASLPLVVDVDDVSDGGSVRVEPVWITYQSTGVFRVTYVVPQEAMSLEVRVMLFGKHVGLPYYPVHTCTAMPLELAKTFGQSGDTSSFGVAAGKPGVKLLQPRDIAVAGNATFLCVTDVERHQVIMYSASDCRFLRRIGEPTDTDHEVDPRNPRAYVGRLHHPWGVAIAADNDTIAVTDSFNHCVQLFSASNGRCLGTIGNGKGSTPGSFNKPAGVAWDEGGNIFIADSGNHRVQMFTGSGQLLKMFGKGPGKEGGMLAYPLGIDISADGLELYVADSKNNRIVVFDVETGDVTRLFGDDFLTQPITVALSPESGTMFIRENAFDRILVMTTFGDLTCVLGTRLGEEKSFPGKLVGGAGMAVTTFGHMYAVDKENACVVILKAPSKPAPKGSRSITSSLEDDSGSIVSAVTELHDERSSASRRLSTITESTVLSHSRGNLDQRPGKAILIRTPEVSRKLGSRKGHTLSSESKKSSRRRSSDRIEELTLATGSESSSGEEDTSVSIDNPRDRRLVNSVLDKVTSSPARREERSVSPKRSAGSKQRQRVEELSPSETEDSLTYSSSRAASTVGKSGKPSAASVESTVFKAVETGLQGIMDTATASVRKEFELAIRDMEERIVDKMKKLIAAAVKQAVEASESTPTKVFNRASGNSSSGHKDSTRDRRGDRDARSDRDRDVKSDRDRDVRSDRDRDVKGDRDRDGRGDRSERKPGRRSQEVSSSRSPDAYRPSGRQPVVKQRHRARRESDSLSDEE